MKGKKILKRTIATVLSLSMAGGICLSGVSGVFAADSTYSAPTQPMAVNENIITASAHRAASPVLGILGVNAVAGYGMINGSAPADLEAAKACAALGIWGTSLNDNPDPYYWNYFYNFYAEVNGLEASADALVNSAAAGSPIMADLQSPSPDPKLTASIYAHPDILVGVAATAQDYESLSGYDEQIQYYQENYDASYNPEKVAYVPATLQTMIETVHNFADAIKKVEEKTGKTTRYGDVQMIADAYEGYVNGISDYINSNVSEKKTIAIVTAVNEDESFACAPTTSKHYNGASQDRYVEYTEAVTYNIANRFDSTPADGTEKSVNLTADDLKNVDAILIESNNSSSINDALVAALGDEIMIIQSYPSSLYGITMNSVENAMGMAYYNAYLYHDELNIDPVEVCAYFYKTFLHVTDAESLQTVVSTNFASVALPAGISVTLSSDWESNMKTILGNNYYSDRSTGEKGGTIIDAVVKPTDPVTPEEPTQPAKPDETTDSNNPGTTNTNTPAVDTDSSLNNGNATITGSDVANSTSSNSDTVKTGDYNYAGLYASMLFVTGIAGIYTYKKKRS